MVSPAGSETSGFQITDRPTHYIAPDGTQREALWWDEPVERISMERVSGLLQQIDEPKGRQSCYLTSQLNGWVLRGQLTPKEARHIQETVDRDSNYYKYWLGQASFGRDYIAWTGRPGDTAFAVSAILDRRVAFRLGQVDGNTPSQLSELLAKGFAIVLNSECHSRVAFQPNDKEEVFVFDPKYSETTGLHDFQTVLEFQKDPYFVVI